MYRRGFGDLVYKLDFGDWSDTVSKRKKKKNGAGEMHGIRVLQFSILLDVLDE